MKSLKALSILVITLVMCSCASRPQYPAPDTIVAPTPIEGNTGKYMCPFTSDDTICEWVSSGIGAKAGANVGSVVGAYAGQKALEQIPFVGGFIGQKVGRKIGREIAIKVWVAWKPSKTVLIYPSTTSTICPFTSTPNTQLTKNMATSFRSWASFTPSFRLLIQVQS